MTTPSFTTRLRRRAARRVRGIGDGRMADADPEAALRWYRASERIDPGSFSALRRIGDAEALCGNIDASTAAWRQAAALRADHPEPFARLAFAEAWAGRFAEAGDFGARCLAIDSDLTSRHSRASRVQSLLAHIERVPAGGPAEPAHRHVAICGTSYCGSTLVTYLLGSLPGVANAGETHWLIERLAGNGSMTRIDFGSATPEDLPPCQFCRGPCERLDFALRRDLAEDPVDWFDRIAAALGEPILVTADKNHSSMLALDPWLRFDALLLFRPPLESWASTRTKSHEQRNVKEYLAHWDRTYRSLFHALPNRGRKLVANFEAIRRNPKAGLETLCRALDLPAREAGIPGDIAREQHALGGNRRVHRSLDLDAPVEIVERDPIELPPEERRAVERYAARSPILSALRAEHARVFGSAGDA